MEEINTESLYIAWEQAKILFTKELLIDALKEHYIDVCSNGDCIVHNAIDELNKNDKIINHLICGPNLQCQELEDKISYTQGAIGNLTATINEWIDEKELKPDRYWGS
jgi:hypothetical protein